MKLLNLIAALLLALSCAPRDEAPPSHGEPANADVIDLIDGDELAASNAAHVDGVSALVTGDSAAAAAAFERALRIDPDDELARYLAATAHAGNGDAAAALAHLERLAALGSDLVPSPARLGPLAESPELQALLERWRQDARHTEESTVAFRIPERDLYPEGIAHDPVEGVFYVSSLYKSKILRVRPLEDGGVDAEDFAGEGRDGLDATVGMKVDAGRRRLWVASVAFPGERGYTAADEGRTALHQYDLESGALVARYVPEEASHGFNDLDLAPSGEAYATDMAAGTVWRASADGGGLEPLLPPETFRFPNGIAVADDGATLYIADWNFGLSAVDIETREVIPLSYPRGTFLRVADGLYYHQGSLLGVLNLAGPGRIMRLTLDETGTGITRVENLEIGHPLFTVPTTGTLVEGAFFYLANSQLNRRAPDGGPLPLDELDETVVLRLGL